MSAETLFHLEGICFAYDPAHPVLDRVDFALAADERVALAGPNGAGKTTLLHLLVGLLTPQAGRLVAFGRERRKETDFHEVRAQAGLLFQDSDDQLFCPTVAEDVAFGPLNRAAPRRGAGRRALDMVGLAGFESRVPTSCRGAETAEALAWCWRCAAGAVTGRTDQRPGPRRPPACCGAGRARRRW